MGNKLNFDHYRICQHEDGSPWELGCGAMGITYKAEDVNLRTPVALKVIRTEAFVDETKCRRFVKEARAAAAIQHPNVAAVYHLSSDGEDFFYAMEFIDGLTAHDLVERSGPLPVRTALQITLQVARALGAATRHQLVHRDIKPANLMIVSDVDGDPDGGPLVKVIDFGLVRSAVRPPGVSGLTIDGFVGTPQYASPEQIEEQNLDVRSDIYSLGCTLWFLLTGRPPFQGPIASIFAQQLYDEPRWDEVRHLPEVVRDLLGHLLQKDPALRPQTPAELRFEVERDLALLNRPASPVWVSTASPTLPEGGRAGSAPEAGPRWAWLAAPLRSPLVGFACGLPLLTAAVAFFTVRPSPPVLPPPGAWHGARSVPGAAPGDQPMVVASAAAVGPGPGYPALGRPGAVDPARTTATAVPPAPSAPPAPPAPARRDAPPAPSAAAADGELSPTGFPAMLAMLLPYSVRLRLPDGLPLPDSDDEPVATEEAPTPPPLASAGPLPAATAAAPSPATAIDAARPGTAPGLAVAVAAKSDQPLTQAPNRPPAGPLPATITSAGAPPPAGAEADAAGEEEEDDEPSAGRRPGTHHGSGRRHRAHHRAAPRQKGGFNPFASFGRFIRRHF